MSLSVNRNVDRQNSTGIVIEAEDDDPGGIRGLSYSPSPQRLRSSTLSAPASTSALRPSSSPRSTAISGKPSRGNQPIIPHSSSLRSSADSTSHVSSHYHLKVANDPLDAAIIERHRLNDEAYLSPSTAALKLDQFVLGRTEARPDAGMAQGSLSRSGSAYSSLKGVADGSRSLAIPTPDRHSIQGSPGALTWASSSPSSCESSPTSRSNSSSPESVIPQPLQPQQRTHNGDEVNSIEIKRMIKQICVAGLGKVSRNFCLDAAEIRDICRAAREVFLAEPSFLRVDAPIRIVGDIHGQFRDLMRLFKKGGMPPSQRYLFLGDYVDRGKQSLETVMLLLLLKLRYPTQIYLLRGNHECAGVTKVYGFYDECKRRASIKSWRTIIDVFNTMPVAALVGGRIFCVHGGISPTLTTFSQIEAVRRPTDVPDSGLVADLLWSDPDAQVKEWGENDRGVSFCFGQRSLERFCRQLNVDIVVRGHMVVEDGYEFFGGRRLVTVFSAPNYCGDFDNYGAMMSISSNLVCSFDVIEPKGQSRNTQNSRTSSPTHHEMSKTSQHKNTTVSS